jgi:methylmalonyl-CoA mutase cobalamin-binding domain/chain
MVIFQPSGRRGEVPKGINVLEASRLLGADIEALCGEKKVCGKCKVRIEEGRFEKYGIESTMANVSAWQEEEEKFIFPKEKETGHRLACVTEIQGDLLVFVPEESRAGKQVVIGSIQGDVHDIGKNLVKMMFDVAGWEVYDLGRDVPLENFVEEQLRTDAEVVAMSAMMTTTMLGMKKVIKMIKDKNPDVAIMLGGAPVTQDVANLFGADGYAESAGNAVAEGIKMIGRLREFEKKKEE